MEKVIVYKISDGRVAVISPFGGSGLTIEEIADKDVPSGHPYKIINTSDLPQDRATRSLWDVDEADLTDGVGADYGVTE